MTLNLLYSHRIVASALLAIGSLSLFACTQNTTHTPVRSWEPPREVVVWHKEEATPEDKERTMAAVKEKLRDPESARFQNIYALQGSNGKRSYCGFVNAKNAFGGYVGKTLFHFSPPDIVFMANDPVYRSVFPKICEQRVVE